MFISVGTGVLWSQDSSQLLPLGFGLGFFQDAWPTTTGPLLRTSEEALSILCEWRQAGFPQGFSFQLVAFPSCSDGFLVLHGSFGLSSLPRPGGSWPCLLLLSEQL